MYIQKKRSDFAGDGTYIEKRPNFKIEIIRAFFSLKIMGIYSSRNKEIPPPYLKELPPPYPEKENDEFLNKIDLVSIKNPNLSSMTLKILSVDLKEQLLRNLIRGEVEYNNWENFIDDIFDNSINYNNVFTHVKDPQFKCISFLFGAGKKITLKIIRDPNFDINSKIDHSYPLVVWAILKYNTSEAKEIFDEILKRKDFDPNSIIGGINITIYTLISSIDLFMGILDRRDDLNLRIKASDNGSWNTFKGTIVKVKKDADIIDIIQEYYPERIDVLNTIASYVRKYDMKKISQ